MDALGALMRLGGGHTLDELYAAILRVSEEVTATGNPGKVTLTLNIERPKSGDPAIVIVKDAIATAPPKSVSNGALFFAVNGELHNRDPRQTELPLRVIDGDTGEIRDAAHTPVIKEA